MHRYQLVYLYYKHRKNKVTDPPSRFAELPKVTIQLPIFNEQYVIDRLVDSVCKMDYPREKLEIQVLDDSTDETVQVASAVVERYAAMGYNISYHHRTNREGYKAGALDAGLKKTDSEFIAIFDADFTPYSDWLQKVIHHFADPEIGMVQTRWTHLNRNYSFLTEVEAILLDGHFVLEHGGRSRAGVFFNFNGTAGMWRRKAIDDAGGWEHDTLTEDTDLSYRSQLKGWKFRYLQDVECPAELPIEMTAFKTQQARWAKGLIQCAKKDLPYRAARRRLAAREDGSLVSPDGEPQLSADDRAEHAADAGDDDPLRTRAGFRCSTSTCRCSWRRRFPSPASTWCRRRNSSPRPGCEPSCICLPLMGLGIGLTITNSKAVIEALVGHQEPRLRARPSIAWSARQDKSAAAKKYRKRLGLIPYIELLIGCLFCGDHLVCDVDGELLHGSVPVPVRLWILVHGNHVAAARPLRRLRSGARRRRAQREAVPGGSVEGIERYAAMNIRVSLSDA